MPTVPMARGTTLWPFQSGLPSCVASTAKGQIGLDLGTVLDSLWDFPGLAVQHKALHVEQGCWMSRPLALKKHPEMRPAHVPPRHRWFFKCFMIRNPGPCPYCPAVATYCPTRMYCMILGVGTQMDSSWVPAGTCHLSLLPPEETCHLP